MKIQNPFTKSLANKKNNDILLQPVDLAKDYKGKEKGNIEIGRKLTHQIP
jgi:hypothetical protein